MSMRSAASSAKQSFVPRRLKRMEETQEIQIRTTHRRRKVLTRGGVLAGFAMSMVIYPAMGTIAPHDAQLDNVPGIERGEAPSTAHALLGTGPQLVSSDLPLPSPDDQARAIAVNNPYTESQHLPDCSPSGDLDAPNGELPDSVLCNIWGGQQLRADAAVALAELNYRYKLEFGRSLCITSSYRTIGEQYAIKRQKGYLAATPGKSFHGWGLAIDLCNGDYRGASKEWLTANGTAYGWINPDWAKTRIYEPWHWEYLPGTRDYDPYGNGGGSDGTRESDDGGVPDTNPDPAPEPSEPDPAPAPKPKPTASTPPPEEEPEPEPSPSGTTSADDGA